MPTTRRSRRLEAAPEEVWRVVGDPYHLPRWWPKVERVEAVAGERFTELLRAKSGRAVRADFKVLEKRRGRRLGFEQELAGSPSERVLSISQTEIATEPEGQGPAVEITSRQRLRG